jgi:putative chitinase
LAADGIVGEGTWGKLFPTQQLITEPAPVKSSTPSGSGFKLENLRGHIPDSVIAQIPDTAKKFNITTPLRLAHFLAQCGHESGGFKAVQENLNYSAKGLMGIFKKYFPTQTLAEQYQRNPQKIASKVYGGRMGNGPESTGEGFKFRGRGYIQLTGKQNYTNFAKFIGEDTVSNPDLVATKYPLASAAFFFDSNKLWSICDKGADNATVTAVTKRVNGGTIGLPDRIKHFKEYYHLLA